MNTKTLRVQSMRNGLIFYVRKNGEEEGQMIMDDGSEAYKAFREAFDACEDAQAAEDTGDHRASAGGAEAEHEPEPQEGPGIDLEDLAGLDTGELAGRLLVGGLSWLNDKERQRKANRGRRGK